jgi:hypothetical protein
MPDGAAMEGQLRGVLACCALPRADACEAGCNQRATTVQINANKRKQNCFLLLSFTIVIFLESGLFNSLQAIQIKKFRSVSARV